MGFSSIYTGATGMLAHGDRMQVIGNNLANVSTIGFKKSDVLFSDLISQEMPNGQIDMAQVGKGVRVAETMRYHLQGSFEDGDYATDVGVSGNGFFGVATDDGTMFYTRAGNFRFNNQGELVNPNGFHVQGYPIDRETGEVQTSSGNIVLPYEDVTVDGETMRLVQSQPQATTAVSTIISLDSKPTGQANDPDNPFFSLADTWNGLSSNASFAADYSTAINVYDDQGNSHELTVHLDRVPPSDLSNANPGQTHWEFIITSDPAEDARAGLADTSAAGLLAMGTLTFNDGVLVNETMFEYAGGASQDVKDLGNWSLAGFGSGGVPAFDMTFAGGSNASPGTQEISWDFGISSQNNAWVGGSQNASGVSMYPDNLASLGDPYRDALSTTDYNISSATLDSSQNGYGQGYLVNLSVDSDGFLVGNFSNGQVENLAQMNLYRFNSEFGLRQNGSNLYSATDHSGQALESVANENGCGSILGDTLESSNVDMAEEFAKMILTQRGFQSNSKVVTTSDSLLNTTISLKR